MTNRHPLAEKIDRLLNDDDPKVALKAITALAKIGQKDHATPEQVLEFHTSTGLDDGLRHLSYEQRLAIQLQSSNPIIRRIAWTSVEDTARAFNTSTEQILIELLTPSDYQ